MNKNYLQYFTDQAIVKLALARLGKQEFHTVIDPAMGEGAFLHQASTLWPQIKLFGVDLDRRLVRKIRARFGNASHFICGDSLFDETFQKGEINKILRGGGFDLVVGNPPFSRQRVNDQSLLKRFGIANPSRNGYYWSQTCEVLFIEQFVKLCRDGGYIVMIVPNGLLCNPRDLRIRKFVLRNTDVREIISIPRQIFNGTEARTAVLILRKKGGKTKQRTDRRVLLHKLDRTAEGFNLNGTVLVNQEGILERMDYDFHDPALVSAVHHVGTGDFKIKMLAEVVRYIACGHTLYGRRRRFSRQGGIRYISSRNVTLSGLDYCKELKFVKRASPMDRHSAHVKFHDMLFVRVGEGCLGRVTVVRNRRDLGIANDCIWIIRTKVLSPYYIALILQTDYGKKLIKRGKQKSTGADSISKKSFLGFAIPVLDRKIRRRLIQHYKKKVLDLHSHAVARGLRRNREAYLQTTAKAQANLREILENLNDLIITNRTTRKALNKGNVSQTVSGSSGGHRGVTARIVGRRTRK